MDQYGRRTDEYGNPVSGGDQFGTTGGTEAYMNQPGATGPTGGYGTGMTTETTGGYGTQGGAGMTHGNTGVAGLGAGGGHRRSGSSSSSSSEDDGHGGRRKKGLKEKIKEKLPGGHKDDPTHGGVTSGAGGYGGVGYEQGHGHTEKKGMMEKIKEKLPGHH